MTALRAQLALAIEKQNRLKTKTPGDAAVSDDGADGDGVAVRGVSDNASESEDEAAAIAKHETLLAAARATKRAAKAAAMEAAAAASALAAAKAGKAKKGKKLTQR